MPTGVAQTYDLTTGVIVDIEEMIHMISPTDVPLQGGLGAGGESVLATGTCFEKKVEWQDEDLLLPKSAIQTTTTTGDAFIVVTAGDQLKFSTGDVILVANANQERMRVTGYGSTTDSLTVTRAFQSTTAATVTAAQTVLILGQALAEGSDPEAARQLDRNNRFNWTQIFGPTAVHVTGTENVVRKYGLQSTSEFEKQAANRTKEQYIQIEQAIAYGKLLEDTGNAWRTMGGFVNYITTNVDSSTATITEALLLAQMETAFNAGGNPDRLLIGTKTKRIISAWNTNITLQASRVDNGRGFVVNYFDSDFGRVTTVMSRWVRTGDAFGFNRDQVSLETLRPMQFEMLAKTGDSLKGQILCEKTLRFRRQQHAFRFSALT